MALSPTAKAAMFSQETEQVIIALLTITHPGTGEVFRISSDPTARWSDDPLMYHTVSRGQGYLFIPFQLVLPESSDEGSGNARLVISNVERELVPLLRHFLTPASVLIELILASSPDVVEMAMPALEIIDYHNTAEVVTMQLAYPSLTQEPYPSLSFTPNYMPALFR